MDALPLFAAGGFRQWMVGNKPQNTQPVRNREDGIRGSEESTTLRDNDLIFQHIVESSRCHNDHHVGTDGRRMTSHGSTTAASDTEGPPKPAELDAIEAEIDTIKADIQTLRAGAESMHQSNVPYNNDRQCDLRFRVEASKIPAPISSQVAARAGGSKRGEVTTLTGKTQVGTLSSSNIPSPHFMPSPHFAPSSPHFAQPTQAATRRVHQTLRKDTPPVKSSPEASPGRSTKATAPDFATDKRAAQRNQKRTSLPQSWTMSTPSTPSTPDPEACKWATHSTRPYYPEVPDPSPELQLPALPLTTTGSGTPPANAQPAEQDPKIATPQKNTSPSKSSPTEQSPGSTMLRKKTSSYMSPTASAQRRNLATIGQASLNRMPTRFNARNLRINTARANGDATAVTPPMSFSTGPDTGSDEFFTPKSHANSKRSPKKGSCSPLKTNASVRPTVPVVAERPSSAMKLPMPLPHVANTVVTRQEPDHNLLDPIKEKLGKEDLLRHTLMQEQPSTTAHSGSNNDILKPVLAHMNRPMAGRRAGDAIDKVVIVADTESAAGSSYSGHSPSDGSRHFRESGANRDPNNEPISRLISGLRGLSSAEIGKALAGKQPTVSATSDPAVIYQGRKPSVIAVSPVQNDPAILYNGRKPSADSGPHQDPVVVVSSKREVPQHSSLRATAMSFVPTFAAEGMSKTEPAELNTCWPKGPSLFHNEQQEFNQSDGTGYLQDYQGYQPTYLRYDQDYISGETPNISPTSSSSFVDEQASSPFHQGFTASGSPTFSPWSYDAFTKQPTATDPAFLEFQANLANSESSFIAPYLNATEMENPIPLQRVYGSHQDFLAGGETPMLSSVSNGTSSSWSTMESERTSPQWQIDGAGRRRFRWSGGDGREISFRGQGPDAEYNPNSPVEYRDYRTNTRIVHEQGSKSPGSPADR